MLRLWKRSFFPLQWRVNPPTALAFVRQFLELIPVDVVDQRTLRQRTILPFQTELAVTEHFRTVKVSLLLAHELA
jgi:hypothetical protein